MKRDRENGSAVSPDREVLYISSSYRIGTRIIPGTTRLEDNIDDVWHNSYPKAGDAVVDLRREGWNGVKRTGIGLGIGLAAGSLVSLVANPSALVAGTLIGGAVGAGLGFHNFDGFLGSDREDFRCKNPLQAFTLANNIERLAHQVAADKVS